MSKKTAAERQVCIALEWAKRNPTRLGEIRRWVEKYDTVEPLMPPSVLLPVIRRFDGMPVGWGALLVLSKARVRPTAARRTYNKVFSKGCPSDIYTRAQTALEALERSDFERLEAKLLDVSQRLSCLEDPLNPVDYPGVPHLQSFKQLAHAIADLQEEVAALKVWRQRLIAAGIID